MKKHISLLLLCQSLLLATDVSGTISSDTTWTNVNNPYIVTNNITVDSGVTLTINPDVIIKFKSKTGMQINGILEVNATAGHEAYFTAYTDDSIGGDTNEDNTTTTPAADYWGGIKVIDNASANVRHAVIRYGGNYNPYHYMYSLLYKEGNNGTLTVSDTNVTDSSRSGIRLVNSKATNTFDQLFFARSNPCFQAENSTFDINGSSFSECTGNGAVYATNGSEGNVSNSLMADNTYGVYLANGSSADIHSNTLTGNSIYGLYLNNASLDTLLNGNTFDENAEPIRLSGNSIGQDTGTNIYSDVPKAFIDGTIDTNTTLRSTDLVYIGNNFTVNAGKKLTIGNDIIIKFKSKTGMQINGILEVNATAGHEAYFTAYTDDSIGGDTNEDNTTTTPAADYWGGIKVIDNASANVRHAVIRYGGNYNPYHYMYSLLYKEGNNGTLTVSDTNVTDSSRSGIRLVNSKATNTFDQLFFARSNPCFQAENSTFDINGSSFSECTGNGAVYATNGSEGNVSNSLMADSTYGVYLNTSDSNITNNTISKIQHNGVKVYKSLAAIRGNTIRQSAQEGIYLSGVESNGSMITNNTIYHNKVGIDIRDDIQLIIGGSLPMSNDIYLNTDFGIQNHSTSVTVNADYNWWGDEQGPYHDPQNLQGEGNTVSDNIVFEPYMMYSINRDDDNDTINNYADNCRIHFNPEQTDSDGDGIGDTCDPYPDDPNNDEDKDGIAKAADNCPATFNPPPFPPQFDIALSGSESGILFSSPTGILIEKEGRYTIVDSSNNRIVQYDTDTDYIGNWGSEGNLSGEFKEPEFLAIGLNNHIYVSDSGNKRIEIFDSNGSYLTSIEKDYTNAPLFERPRGIAIDTEGYIYAIDNNQTIKRFYPDGTLERVWGSEGNGNGEFMDAADIAVDNNRTIYITDAQLNRVQKFDRYGHYLGQWGEEGNQSGELQEPVGITVDMTQRVYISNSGNKRIDVFEKNGTILSSWEGDPVHEGSYGYPYGIATTVRNGAFIIGMVDSQKNQLLIYRSLQTDSDGDNIGDACDPDNNDGPLGDVDGDGILNKDDMYPNDGPLGDWDGDGIPNNVDPDDSDGFGPNDPRAHYEQGYRVEDGRISGTKEQDTQPYPDRECGYFGRSCIQGTQEDNNASFDSDIDPFLPDRPSGCDTDWVQGTGECLE